MAGIECKTFSAPDEVRTFEKGKLELVKIGCGVVGRLTLEPGWRWSTHVKPVAGTEWCEAPHFQYHVAGRIHVRMRDGSEIEAGPGEITTLAAGHDAWVVGDEPVVLVDWAGAGDYAKQKWPVRSPAPRDGMSLPQDTHAPCSRYRGCGERDGHTRRAQPGTIYRGFPGRVHRVGWRILRPRASS